ncbi:hypothetical protein A0J61_07866 [Choanephora cucurbitarum]|uniref:BZIP domain-containing protein n=1 Tax=Choanephora cucurbitarum TaxID=101091 RepID=A0A1C7N4Q8_9FUNG|nr:hypothetical protein A0J61_07866 [Choanephora cucurbitarum]
MNTTTLADIVQKIASQGNNPDVSFLKDDPEAQTMLLLALLSNNNVNTTTVEKRKYDASDDPISPPPPVESPTKSIDNKPKKVGRKPLTSEEEDSDNPKSKRKAQNRAAQRAFRERKENHVRVLEERVRELEQKISQQSNTDLAAENEKLKATIRQLEDENHRLLGATTSFDLPLVSEDGTRPQKLIRSSNHQSPISYFDSFSSTSSSNKSRSNTPEETLSLDDILQLPSNTLIDHSELLGLADDSLDLNNFFDQQKFTTDPSQFDFFYPVVEEPNKKKKKDVTQVWDDIANHPRFDEFDMDDLCDKMTKKATCSDYNHDKELKNLIDEHYPV